MSNPWGTKGRTPPAQSAATGPAPAGPHPATPVSGVLGRALLDSENALWRKIGVDEWACGTLMPKSRAYIERSWGPVREVLLVDAVDAADGARGELTMPTPTFEDVRAQAYRELGNLLDGLRSNRPAYAAVPAPTSEQLDAVRDARQHIVAAREALNNAAG